MLDTRRREDHLLALRSGLSTAVQLVVEEGAHLEGGGRGLRRQPDGRLEVGRGQLGWDLRDLEFGIREKEQQGATDGCRAGECLA